MRIFDELNPASVERRESQLWFLALTIMFVLTAGIALMMYPHVFAIHPMLNGWMLKVLFFGFCCVSLLAVGYLGERQFVIGRLRRRLEEENARFDKLRQQASMDMVASLPGIDRFRDCLAMEFRRASNTNLPITLVTIGIQPSIVSKDKSDLAVSLGDALKAITRKLRGEDSIYHFAPGVFGIVLPGLGIASGQKVASRLGEGLEDASGASSRFSYTIGVTNFPEQVTSAREMEGKALAALPEELAAPVEQQLLAV